MEQALAEKIEYIEMRRLLKAVYARALEIRKTKIDRQGRLTISQRQEAQKALNEESYIQSKDNKDKLLTNFVDQAKKIERKGKLSQYQRPMFRQEFRKTHLDFWKKLLENDASGKPLVFSIPDSVQIVQSMRY